MKALPRSVFLLLAGLLLLAGCGPRGARSPRVEVDRQAAPARPPESGAGEELAASPKAPVDRGEVLVQILNCNLDLDLSEEQILVLRKKGEAESPLRIAVVDYDSVRASYARTWEGQTAATTLRLFEVSLKDLVGDHNQEIVCRGLNSRGELTLNVFRKTPAPTGLGLYFVEICSLASDGSIEIQEIERSEGYRQGQKNGPSFPIYTYTRDTESANLLDRVKHTYQWQYAQNRYVLASVQKLPGVVVEEAQLRELFADPSLSSFENYIAGPWYLSGPGGREEIILFDPQEKLISLYSGQVEEIYVWQTSFRSLSNRLLILAANESIESVVKRITVEVVSLNTIDVSILGAEEWDRTSGRYVKLTDELQTELLKQREQGWSGSVPALKGVYSGVEGMEIIFDPPRFTWIEEKRQFSGGFAVVRLDRSVLLLKALAENGLPGEADVYILGYEEKEEEGTLRRLLTLTPGRIGVHGAEPVSEKRFQFEQRETLAKP